MKHKSRLEKAVEYECKYSHIPIDQKERLSWLYDKLHISDEEAWEILKARDLMLGEMYFNDFNVVLYEVPEGTPRPRARLVNRKNISNMAIENSKFIKIYSLTGAEDHAYIKQLMTEGDFEKLDHLICTPCDITINVFFQTPSAFCRKDKILSEIGLIRPLVKPDWDNIGKKYSDMFNANVWLDDQLVVSGTVNKFYSCLPRIEIRLRYLDRVYNSNQFKAISKRQDFDNSNPLSYYGMD